MGVHDGLEVVPRDCAAIRDVTVRQEQEQRAKAFINATKRKRRHIVVFVEPLRLCRELTGLRDDVCESVCGLLRVRKDALNRIGGLILALHWRG